MMGSVQKVSCLSTTTASTVTSGGGGGYNGHSCTSVVVPDQFPVGLRVLVVDDDTTCLRILEQMLRKCSYHVTTCCQATVALNLLRERKGCFDVVISDVHMPDMDGFKLLELVGLEMDLPVIMMSADGRTSAVMRGIKHGACDYLIKPVRVEELKNIWQHVIRKKWNGSRDLEQSSSIEETDRCKRGGDDIEYASSANEGTDGSWKVHKKRKDTKEEEEEGDLDNDDPSTSKKPRVVWSVELHQQFVGAVNQLGIDKAVPKRILELMNVPGLTRENVASHLQKFRLYLKRLSGVAQQQSGISTPTYISLVKFHSGWRFFLCGGFRSLSRSPLSSSRSSEILFIPLQSRFLSSQPLQILSQRVFDQFNEISAFRCFITEMASPVSSMSVSVECVNLCKLSKGDGVGKYECSVLSCAWKAPRALTGFLATTTAHTHSSSSSLFFGPTRCKSRSKSSCERYGFLEMGDWYSSESGESALWLRLSRCSGHHVAGKRWQFWCSSSSLSDFSDPVSPQTLWEDLKPGILYLPPEEMELVHNALKLAFEAHDGQRRRSGEPFIIHPVEVARILGELELDWESIAAGLLHDTVEDTDVVTFERIEREFGATVRRIVEGETKVSKLGKLQCSNENNSVQDVKADDLRQMFLAMTEEVRVIIVKLADRLHNMRTLSYMPHRKQSSIACETLQVFAPLAKLLGMYQIKSELENLSFMYTNACEYVKVQRRVAELHREHEKDLIEAKKILIKRIKDDQFLDLVTVKTEVRSVCKEPYSIYKAALKSKGSINEVNQITQLRIIVKPKPCVGVGPLCSAQQICYHILGLVHGIWTPIPRAMKDYIATPKPNGYQSLHTTVIPFLYESMFRLEVQIRTEEMDLIAERGIAAHYSGKRFTTDLAGHIMAKGRSLRGKSVCLNDANIALRIGWLNAIREWQEEFVGNMSSREFVDTITRDLLGSRVFVFTPKGEIKNLPKGATVIDYAYMIHTEIGNKMVAAKVNGNLVSPTHELANAEVVEIVTYNALSSKSAFQRHQHWLEHARTRSARHKIMKFLKEQAAMSATELTAEAISNFTSDVEEEEESESEQFSDSPKENEPLWKKILMNVAEFSTLRKNSGNIINESNGRVSPPKINGKHNKNVKYMSLKAHGESLSQGNGIAKLIHANIPIYKELLPGLESWQVSKVASWHNLEGHSVQWFCVICIDRRGMLTEVTSALTSVGITICSCVAEIDRRKGVGVMLFHFEGSLESLVNACSSVDLILGVLSWSAGCSWPSSLDNEHYLEC